MLIRRYRGTSLSDLEKTVKRELGEQAVIAHVEKTRPPKKWLRGFSVEYVVVAVADEVHQAGAAANADNDDSMTTMFQEQKRQYKGVRRSMQMIDEKLVELNYSVGDLHDQFQRSTPVLPSRTLNADSAKGLEQFKQLASGQGNAQQVKEPGLDQIPVVPGLDFSRSENGPRVFLFAGPTGVGKTTTLAKLAADCVLSQRRKVSMITMDTYRIAGVEQLRQYADLLGVSLHVAFTASELKKYIEQAESQDVVFIDTPGRSQFNRTGIDQIQDTMSKFGDPYSLLLVSANVRREDADSIYAGFGRMNPDSLIVTKTDEATVCDGLPQLCNLTNVPVSYVTDGQRVPEDIRTATSETVAELEPNTGINERNKGNVDNGKWY